MMLLFLSWFLTCNGTKWPKLCLCAVKKLLTYTHPGRFWARSAQYRQFARQAKLCLIVARKITHNFADFLSDKFYEISTQQRHSVSPCKLSKQNFENFTIRGRFSRKTQKIAYKISGLATSGRLNSTMITNRRKFTTKLTLYGMSCFHFYR